MKSKLLFLLLFLPTILSAEGTKEVWLNLPNHTTWLYLCNDLTNHCGGFGGDDRSNFAVYDCDADERLFFITETADEIVYMGFNGDPGSIPPDNYKIVYRIRDEFGTIVQAEADLPTAGAGYIPNVGQARVGPSQIYGVGGYDAFQFTPPGVGVYYIEFSLVDGLSGVTIQQSFNMELFDITVYDNVLAEVKPGRLYSKGWQFIDGNGGFGGWDVNSSTFYIYSTDSIVTSVTYDEMEGRAWLMFCNQFGVQNTGNFTIDRMSIAGQAYVPQYNIFLNEPDSTLFPPASTPGQVLDVWAEPFCDGSQIFHVTVDKPGNVDILLDFPAPFQDRNLQAAVNTGVNMISWDGLDALGAPVWNGTLIDFTITYINGLTNLPLYDIEENLNGFSIALVAPTGTTPLVYWDDSNIGGGMNLTGCNSTPPLPGCHSWGDGNAVTTNTWWFTASTSSLPVTITEIRFPGTLVFNQPPQAYCAGEQNVSISVTADFNTDTYNFSYTGTGATINQADPADNFITIDFDLLATPGNIEVYGSNANCGDGPVTTLAAAIAPLPGAEINVLPNDTVCVNETISFFGTDTNSLAIINWLWDFGDGNTSNVQNPTHAYTATFSGQVRLIVITDQLCRDTAYFPIEVVNPTIDFSLSPNPACITDTVYFTGSGDATFTDWLWDFGDGQTDIGKNVSHKYDTPGLYTVVLNVCNKSVNHDVDVIPAAVADAGAMGSVCEGIPYDFALAPSPAFAADYASLQWHSDGAGTFNNNLILHPVYTPAAGEFGITTFTLIAYGLTPCANDTSVVQLQIFDGPEADYIFTPPDSLCVNELIAFDATSTTTITNWVWDYDDGTFATGQNVTHAFSTPGIFDVMLSVTNSDGCTDTVIYPVEIFALPSAGFTVNPGGGVCLNEPFDFTDASTGNVTRWYWDMDDGITYNTQNVNHTYVLPGTYDVSLYVYNQNSCRDTMTQTVTVFALPVCDFTISPNDSSCVNELVTFNGTGTPDIIIWDWDFGDGTTGTGQVINHVYTIPGTYDIQLIASNGNTCTDTIVHQRVVVEPVIDFSMNLSPTCEGYIVDFAAIGAYDFTNYVWDFGDGNNATGRNVTNIYTTPNTYTVTLTFCTSQVQHDILVNPLPLAFAGQDTVSCEDVPFDLSTLPFAPFASNYSSILWSGGLGTFDDPTSMAPIYTPGATELGFVTLQMVAYGIAPCYNDTSFMTIEVIEGAYAFAGSDEDHCQDSPFDFSTSAQVPIAYNEIFRLWTHDGTGTLVDPTVEVPVYLPGPGETGIVNFTFVASNVINCDSVDYMQLTIHPTYFEVHMDTICFGDSLLLPGGGWGYNTGTYYDTLFSVWTCDSIIETNLFERPQIDADFVIAPRDSACIDDAVFFTRTGASTLVSWMWDFDDGNFSTDLNPTHAYATSGTYDVMFTFTDNFGCQDTVIHQVFVFQHPDVDFSTSAASACLNTGINFFGVSTDVITLWEWDFGDGSFGTGQNTTHTYTTYGVMNVTLTVTADNGCVNTMTRLIFVAAPPEADFISNIYSCDSIQFTDLSTAPPGFFLVEWEWDFGDGTTSDLQHPLHVFPAGGIYPVSLVVYADSAGIICSDSITQDILVPERPTVYFTWSPEPTCLGEVTTFFGTSGTFIQDWYWDFDDGNYATVQNPEHTYAAAGTYNVTLFVTDANGCWDTVAHQVTVVELPDVSFTVDPNPTCVGEQTAFSGSSSAVINTWLWDFGDGGTAIIQDPLHVYTSAGSYQVTLWAGDTNNCFNATTQTVVVNPMPIADFIHSAPVCSGDTVYFYNQSVSPNGGIDEWTWDFGDGNSVTINAPNDPDVFHVYATGGSYDVTLTVRDTDSCSNSITKPVTITDGPLADFNYVDNCTGQPVEFTDISSPNGGSPIVSWYWEFDDPLSGPLNTSNLQHPTHLFTSPGTFDVLLMVTNVEGCSNTIVLPVDVLMAPQVSFTTDSDSACVDSEIAFTGVGSTSLTWQWDFGDGGTSVVQNPGHVYSAAGTYTVTVVVTDGNGCTNFFSAPVYINPLPIADFTFSALPCSGSEVDFIDISSPMNAYLTEWHWTFGDGSDTIITAPGPGDVSHIYATPGVYTVSLLVLNSNGCEDSISYIMDVIQGPESDFEHSGDICQGGVVEFTDLSQGFGSLIQGWFWQFGDPMSGVNNTSSLQNPTHMYAQSGTYYVSLMVTSNTGCQHTSVDTIVIAPAPTLDFFINPDTSCFGEPTYFFTDPDSTIIAEVTSYAWNFGDPASGVNDTSNLQNPVHTYTAPGVYQVTLSIINVDGCENTQVHLVEINPPPVADFAYEQGCLGDSTLFTDLSLSTSGNITSWLWNFGDPASGSLNTSTLQNPGHVFSGLGTYSVQLIATDYFGCSDTIHQTLAVDYAPISFYTYHQACDPPGMIYFSDSSFIQAGASPIVEWLWEIEPGYFSSEINPTYTFTEFDTCYVVLLTVTDANGCENTFMDSVCVTQPLGVDFTFDRVCQGYATFFDGEYSPTGDSITSWHWDFGDGNFIITDTDTISYTYQNPGTYFVTLTIENSELCERTITRQVIVDALPAVDFSFTESICDEPTEFTDMTDPGFGAFIQSWQWNFGDPASGPDNTSPEQNPVHQYPGVDSSYIATLVVTNTHGCVDSVSYTVVKGLCMQALFEVSGDNQCNNTQVCFIDSSFILGDGYDIQLWQWNMGDGQTYEYNHFTDSICHTYEQWGTYQVSLTITSQIEGSTYSNTYTRQVTVSAVPEARMAFTSPCVGAGTQFIDASFTNGVEIISRGWDFGDPLNPDDTSSMSDPGYTYTQSGTFTVTLIVENANGCVDTNFTDIRVYENPIAGFSSSLGCAGGWTTFTDESQEAEGELTTWLWSFGTGETSGDQNPGYVYTDPGNYPVEMIVTDERGCRDTALNLLTVFPVPLSAFDIVNNYQNIQGQILLENASENAVRYEWDFGNGDGSELNSPVVLYDENGTYLIELIAWNDNQCPDTAYMQYEIIFQGLYVPTGFTPDSDDPLLSVWKPVGMNLEEYQVTVINENGNVVFQSNKLDANGMPSEGWDGTTNGEKMPTGNYLWKVSAKFRDGRLWNGTDLGDGNSNPNGFLLLIR